MMYSCLEKELGPSLLVGRLSEHSDSVRSSQSTGPRAGRVPTTAKIITTKPPTPYRRLHGPYYQNTPSLESAESRMSADSFNRQPIPAGWLVLVWQPSNYRFSGSFEGCQTKKN